jgi:hypothetical protein
MSGIAGAIDALSVVSVRWSAPAGGAFLAGTLRSADGRGGQFGDGRGVHRSTSGLYFLHTLVLRRGEKAHDKGIQSKLRWPLRRHDPSFIYDFRLPSEDS